MPSNATQFPYWRLLDTMGNMKKSTVILIAIGLVLFFFVAWGVNTYNSLVQLDESAKTSWAQIEVQYQRRMDLIPNLVNTVKGAANFEQSTLEAVTNARSAWAKAGNANEKIDAANQFNSAISRLLVTVESYPTLKATEAFMRLNDELAGTENRIQFARQSYNETVKMYNMTIRMFPGSIIAGMYGFTAKTLFEAKSGAETLPTVSFDKK